jgi:hypothetical protein
LIVSCANKLHAAEAPINKKAESLLAKVQQDTIPSQVNTNALIRFRKGWKRREGRVSGAIADKRRDIQLQFAVSR